MFTGIVATTGLIVDIDRQDGQARFVINTGDLPLDGLQLGDSIAVNGVCLTAVEILPAGFSADNLPVSCQLAASHWNEILLLRAGVAFQKQTDFHKQTPLLS